VITLDLANAVFLGAMLIGGVLLLLTVVLDDIFSGIFDAFGLDFGDGTLMPVALGFVAMFGAGGLIGTQALSLESGPASIVGLVSGLLGGGVAYATFGMLRRMEAPEAFSQQDLVGHTGRVVVRIRANQNGSIHLTYAGATQAMTATAGTDIEPGVPVNIIGVAGSTLIVAPFSNTPDSPSATQV